MIVLEVLCNRDEPPGKPQHRIALRINADLFFPEHPGSGKNQERTEQINDPFKPVDQRDASKNEDDPHCKNADNSPKKDLVLVFPLNSKMAEDEIENKDVVEA